MTSNPQDPALACGPAQRSQPSSTPKTAPTILNVQLHSGSSGVVQVGMENGQLVAVKIMDGSYICKHAQQVLREINHHQQLSVYKHPFIIELKRVCLLNSHLALVLEQFQGTDLEKLMEKHGGRLPKDMARAVFQQLVIVVEFCHRLGKVNRDLKLSSILVNTKGQVPFIKLAGFSFAKDRLLDSEPNTQLGTVIHTAPEIITKLPNTIYDGEPVDVWSCGVILCLMLYGQHPFLSHEDSKLDPGARVTTLIHNSVLGNLQLPLEVLQNPTPELDLVARMLVTDPRQRISLSGVLNHPWFVEKIPAGWASLNDTILSRDLQVPAEHLGLEEVEELVSKALDLYEAECMVMHQKRQASEVGGESTTNRAASSNYTESDITSEAPATSSTTVTHSRRSERNKQHSTTRVEPTTAKHRTLNRIYKEQAAEERRKEIDQQPVSQPVSHQQQQQHQLLSAYQQHQLQATQVQESQLQHQLLQAPQQQQYLQQQMQQQQQQQWNLNSNAAFPSSWVGGSGSMHHLQPPSNTAPPSGESMVVPSGVDSTEDLQGDCLGSGRVRSGVQSVHSLGGPDFLLQETLSALQLSASNGGSLQHPEQALPRVSSLALSGSLSGGSGSNGMGPWVSAGLGSGNALHHQQQSSNGLQQQQQQHSNNGQQQQQQQLRQSSNAGMAEPSGPPGEDDLSAQLKKMLQQQLLDQEQLFSSSQDVVTFSSLEEKALAGYEGLISVGGLPDRVSDLHLGNTQLSGVFTGQQQQQPHSMPMDCAQYMPPALPQNCNMPLTATLQLQQQQVVPAAGGPYMVSTPMHAVTTGADIMPQAYRQLQAQTQQHEQQQRQQPTPQVQQGSGLKLNLKKLLKMW